MKLSALVKNGFWATFGAFATRVLSLLSNLLLARLLLPEEFGVIAVAYIFWSFVNLFTQGSSGSFLVYKGIDDKRYVDTTYTISLILGLALGLGLIAISPIAANFFGVPNLIWILMGFAFHLVLSSVQSVFEGIMTRRMQYRELANSKLISSMLRVFSTVVSAMAGLSYWSFVVGDTVFWVLLFVLTYRHTKYNFRLHIDPKAKSEVLSYCLGGTGSSLGYYVFSNCDNFVVGKLLGTTSLGYYNLAYQLTMALSTILIQAMGQLSLSVFAQLPDEEEQKKSLLKVIEQASFLGTPLYVLFYLIVDEHTVSFIFGKEWISSVPVIPGLLFYAYFRLINGQLFSMLSAKGIPGVSAKINLIIAPFTICAFLIGAVKGGIVGVSIASAIMLGIVWTIYSWWEGCRQIGWSPQPFLILAFQPILLASVPIIISLGLPEILQPIFFIIAYMIMVRLFVPRQFMQYHSFISSLINQVTVKMTKKGNKI
jgi:lipopolysaccharide exporter